jgi:hypothetical protein
MQRAARNWRNAKLPSKPCDGSRFSVKTEATGIAIGIVIGVAIGAYFENVATGIILGLAVGIALVPVIKDRMRTPSCLCLTLQRRNSAQHRT